MVIFGKLDISMILDIAGHSNKDVVGDDRTSILEVLVVVYY